MLARVLKQSAAAGVVPFSVTVLGGDGGERPAGVQPLRLRELEPIEYIAPEPDTEYFADEEDLTPEQLLELAQHEAARIIAKAEEHAAIIEQVASDKAFQKAREEVAAENAAEIDNLRNSLAQTIAKVGSIGEEMAASVEGEVVELALQVAKKVVAREVTIDREIALTLVKVSLAKLHNRVVAEVHLHPDDYAYVSEHLDQLDYRGRIDLVEDKSISLGGSLIHTETGDIDARIESQFDEISHGLMN